MSEKKEKIIQIIEEIKSLPVDPTNDAHLRKQTKFLDEFNKLVEAPFINERAFQTLYQDYVEFSLDVYFNFFERAKTHVTNLALDTVPDKILYSEKSREEGEKDLYHESDTQKLEDAYVFIRYTERGSVAKNVWIEVGSEETITSSDSLSRHSVNFDFKLIAAVVRNYSKQGNILEVSLYHYHPEGSDISKISIRDLIVAVDFTRAYGESIGEAKLDFRVVNTDAIYRVSGIKPENVLKIIEEKADMSALENILVMQNQKGEDLKKFLANYGISIGIDQRPQEKIAPSADPREKIKS